MSASSSLSVLRQAQCALHRSSAGPSTHIRAAVPSQQRYYAQKRIITQKPVVSGSYKGGKDGGDKIKDPRSKSKSGHPVFTPLPVSQLQDPIFQSDRRSETLDVEPFNPDLTTSAYVGNVVAFTPTETDPIRIFGVPTNVLLDHRIASKPLNVIRDVTVTTIDRLQAAAETPSSQTRLVMTGSAGCGKSVLLLQAVEYAEKTGWLVLYIPRAVSIVNSSTTHIYDLRTQTYHQPTFAYQTLMRFLTVNRDRLQNLKTTVDVPLDRRSTVPAGDGLVDLIEIGLRDPFLAPTVLTAVMEELEKQTSYPVLLAVDDFQALYCKTAYRDPHFILIKPWHLSMPRLLLEYASGKKSFARGAVLGAVSAKTTHFKLPIELRKSLGLPDETPASRYTKMSKTALEYAQGLEALPVPEKLQMDEAASLFEAWAKDKALNPEVSKDELFISEYTAAAGNARGFVKGLLTTLTL
ncbi:hypothetical protein NEOLEDRAFT_1162888 [Neolentinus lepideus HHB14362 ss-1]|uniref:Small ribosomal subunit protein mS29 n=1 Tax=Neolentinus lepideus HHB14362 ss-1 TaxID=1314782 RepID=A0A165SIP4_9AGAM|nr:hypothetical protein NEOLEDRAFT_1162888 [Neolentinus lepideus HHB14362 ss-1]